MPDDILHERELREQWQKMHQAMHEADAQSRAVAREEIDRRLEGMNELREQITTERGQYVMRDFYDEQHSALRDSVDIRLKALETSKSNLEGRLWMMGAGISGVVIILNLVLHYLK